MRNYLFDLRSKVGSPDNSSLKIATVKSSLKSQEKEKEEEKILKIEETVQPKSSWFQEEIESQIETVQPDHFPSNPRPFIRQVKRKIMERKTETIRKVL